VNEPAPVAHVDGHLAVQVGTSTPPLLLTQDHKLCPGCGHPISWRLLLETIDALDLAKGCIGVAGHGCYTGIIRVGAVEFAQVLHGRAPAVATGIKRMRPELTVFTVQGDGDMVSEGLAEVIHAAARGEQILAVVLNNGVFGDTGGQMTASTVVGQRSKTTSTGRDAAAHGYPVPIADLVAACEGTAFAARGGVYSAGSIARTSKLMRKAFEVAGSGAGFAFLEILTMCPTGWLTSAAAGPEYLNDSIESRFPLGELALARDARG
jgi:2-oxoglutarate/2-oxoacid ferredoxin oxidoreductase subunit beta